MGVWLMLFIILEDGLAFQRSHRGKEKYIKDIKNKICGLKKPKAKDNKRGKYLTVVTGKRSISLAEKLLTNYLLKKLIEMNMNK